MKNKRKQAEKGRKRKEREKFKKTMTDHRLDVPGD